MGYSDYLYAEPDVAYASGQVLDLLGTPQQYNRSESAAEADSLALARDWAAVGEDLRRTLLRFAQSLR